MVPSDSDFEDEEAGAEYEEDDVIYKEKDASKKVSVMSYFKRQKCVLLLKKTINVFYFISYKVILTAMSESLTLQY